MPLNIIIPLIQICNGIALYVMGVGTVGLFSILLAVFPLWTFSGIRHGTFDTLILYVIPSHYQDFLESNRVVIGGIVAIILVNVIVALFLLVAFVFEKIPEDTTKATKKTE